MTDQLRSSTLSHLHEKKLGWKKPVAAASAVLALMALDACGSTSNNESAKQSASSSESAKPTMQITNTAGQVITVEKRDGKPYSDWNNDGINDFAQDGDNEGTMDGYEYDQDGRFDNVNGDSNQTYSDKTTGELPVNNDLTDHQVNYIIESTPMILHLYPDAYWIIRNLDEYRARAMYAFATHFKDDQFTLDTRLASFLKDDWKELGLIDDGQ